MPLLGEQVKDVSANGGSVASFYAFMNHKPKSSVLNPIIRILSMPL